jgi:hypothetical protein
MMRHEPVPVISDVPIHHKRPAFAFFCVRAFVTNIRYSTAEVRG